MTLKCSRKCKSFELLYFLALRKAHGEKEAMRVEINKFKDQLEDSKEVISLLNSEIETLQNVVRQADSERERDRKEKEKVGLFILRAYSLLF